MMARVRGVIRRSISAGSMLALRPSTSARTGVAPAWMMTLTVAAKVIAVVMTSSPGPTPAATRLRCMAAVQEPTAQAWGLPL